MAPSFYHLLGRGAQNSQVPMRELCAGYARRHSTCSYSSLERNTLLKKVPSFEHPKCWKTSYARNICRSTTVGFTSRTFKKSMRDCVFFFSSYARPARNHCCASNSFSRLYTNLSNILEQICGVRLTILRKSIENLGKSFRNLSEPTWSGTWGNLLKAEEI